jgi:hypothetical protein
MTSAESWASIVLRSVIEGREVTYVLADQGVLLLGGKLRLRQVTRLAEDDNHQTPILISRRDLSAVEVAYRMFERWRQDDFFVPNRVPGDAPAL